MKSTPFLYLCKFSLVAVLLASSISVLASAAALADTPTTPTAPSTPTALPESSFYDGEDLDSAPFSATAWGSGSVDTVDLPGSSGKKALKIDSYGPYEGALFTFTSPGLLGNIKTDRTRYLELVVSLTPPGNLTGSNSGRSNSSIHLAQYSGGSPQGPMGPGSASPDPTTVRTVVPPISALRLVFNLTNGTGVDVMRDIPVDQSSSQWIVVGIPLATLPLTDTEVQGAQLKSLMIAADRSGTIYISKMTLISDSTPIRADIRGSRDVDQNSRQTYTAHATGGPSNLTYKWQFSDDDSTPAGRQVTHEFTTAGNFKVSVTVLDGDELKPGVMVTTSVHVEAP